MLLLLITLTLLFIEYDLCTYVYYVNMQSDDQKYSEASILIPCRIKYQTFFILTIIILTLLLNSFSFMFTIIIRKFLDFNCLDCLFSQFELWTLAIVMSNCGIVNA